MYNLILFLLIVLSVRRNLAFKNNFRKFSIKSKLNAKIKTTFTLSENNINFKENEFSGFNAKLLLSGNGKKNIIDLNRYSKNVLSSGLIELNRFEDINQISIIYDTNPEIIFNKNSKL